MLSNQAIMKAIENQIKYQRLLNNPTKEGMLSHPFWVMETERLRRRKRISISPFYPEQLNPNSYNLRLSNKLLVYDTPGDAVLDMAKDNPTRELTIPPEGMILKPGRLYLGSTVEYTETYNLVPFIEGRSSVARLGCAVHLTAGLGESSFKGNWTLEILVAEPLRVYANVELCQIGYFPVTGDPGEYTGKYQDQQGPQPSQLWRDFRK